MIDEYKRSLKMSAAEELFDLLFYRPFAFVFVKLIYRTRITPNQVTYLSLVTGLTAAWFFSDGIEASLRWGACWYAVANILDCADGQLARLQKSGTLLGRVVDGAVDYISSIAIFVGLGFGLSAIGTSHWWLVVAAGISSAVHALFFDHYQSEYISTVRSERNFLERELEQFTAEVQRLQASRKERGKKFVLSLYLKYLQLQQRTSTKHDTTFIDPELYAKKNGVLIRLWSVLGPTTNRTALIICALAGGVPVYLWVVMIIGNGWLLVCYLLQKYIHRRMETRMVNRPMRRKG